MEESFTVCEVADDLIGQVAPETCLYNIPLNPNYLYMTRNCIIVKYLDNFSELLQVACLPALGFRKEVKTALTTAAVFVLILPLLRS